jgi:hypothetical protein
MKINQILIVAFTLATINTFSQQDSLGREKRKNRITIEPAIGISPLPIVDMNLSNIIQLELTKRFSVISYTSIKDNNLFKRNFNYIRTINNISLSQNIGVGASLYSKKGMHTFSLLGGIKYDTYHEFLDNPEFEKADVKITTLTPDLGFMYNAKIGRKKYFMSYRVYLPLNPYPLQTTDFTAIDGNLANVSLEIGCGIRIK